MQILAIALAAVCAEPEPEPEAGLGLGWGIGKGLGSPLSHGVHGLSPIHRRLVHGGLIHRGLHWHGKREAEAEPEADPEALDPSLHWGHGGVILGSPLGLLGHGLLARPHAWGHGIWKREAEAEPEAEPEADPGYRWGHGSAVVSSPLISRVGLLGHGLVLRPHGLHGAALRPHGHGKREAEAEPEAEPKADPGYRWGHGSAVVYAPLIRRVGLLRHGLVHRPLASRHGLHG